jgi:hypothetical protein
VPGPPERLFVRTSQVQKIHELRPLNDCHEPVDLSWRSKQPEPGGRWGQDERPSRFTEGLPEDITKFVDGALLVDLWSELFRPGHVKAAWQPLIDAARNG